MRVTFILALGLWLGACSTNSASPCGSNGQGIYSAGQQYCVYASSIVVEGGFHCPESIPLQYQIGQNRVVCTATEVSSGSSSEQALCEQLQVTPCTSTRINTTGEACTLENIPDGGLNPNEVYAEDQNPMCPAIVRESGTITNVCLANHVGAQPEPGATYCTCRCATDVPNAPTCACPSGMVCSGLFQAGPDHIRGSYCVRTR